MFNNDFSFRINNSHCTQFLYANSVDTTSSTKRRNSEIFLTLIYSRNLQNASNKDINTTNYRKYQFIDEATIFPVSTIIIKLGSIAKKIWAKDNCLPSTSVVYKKNWMQKYKPNAGLEPATLRLKVSRSKPIELARRFWCELSITYLIDGLDYSCHSFNQVFNFIV